MTTLCWYWRIIGSWEKKEPTSIAAWWVKLYMRLHATMPCYLFSFKKNNIELQRYISEKKEVELSSQVKKKELLWRAIISFYERERAAVEGIWKLVFVWNNITTTTESEKGFFICIIFNFFILSFSFLHFLHNSTHQLNVFSYNLLVLMLRCFSSARSCCNINF